MEAALTLLVLFLFAGGSFFLIAVIYLLVKSSAHSKNIANTELMFQGLQQRIMYLEQRVTDLAGAGVDKAACSGDFASSANPCNPEEPEDIAGQPDYAAQREQSDQITPQPEAGEAVSVQPWESPAFTAFPQECSSEPILQKLFVPTAGESFTFSGASASAPDSSGHAQESAQTSPLKSEGAPLWQQLVFFIKGGHIWVSGGVLLLFIAFGLLLTYMASRGLFSIEIRIALAALSGLLLLLLGWKLHERKPTYSLVLQGGGIGLLYLAVFGATKLTPLLTPVIGLILISLLIPPTVILSLRQQSQPLAIFGLLGGFAAPILLSTDSGNFVALFTYYTLLNIAVLLIGRYRLWRGLNLVAFLCTFGVALVWVLTRYDQEMFARAEPFMLGFIAIFTLLGIFSAKTREIGFKNFIDLSIAFGTPLAGALIQWRMFSYIDHGLPLVSLAFSAYYLLITVIIWKREGVNLRRLGEIYLALSVLLANLAIPLELSPEATSAVWAAEGVILYFAGMRLSSRRVRLLGLAMHFAAATAFFCREIYPPFSLEYTETPLLRYPTYVGSMIIAVSALAVAVLSQKRTGVQAQPEPVSGCSAGNDASHSSLARANPRLPLILSIWGMCWWFAAWWFEFERVYDEAFPLFFIVSSFTALAAWGISRVLCFRPVELAMGAPVIFAFVHITAVLLARAYHIFSYDPLHVLTYNFFSDMNLWAWLLFFASQAILLRTTWRKNAAGGWRISPRLHAMWLFMLLLASATALTCTGRAYTLIWDLSESWTSLAGILPAILFVLVCCVAANRNSELELAHRKVLLLYLPSVLCVSTVVWFIGTLFASGDPAPLPVYIPVLNPLEIEQAFCVAILAFWQICAGKFPEIPAISRRALISILDAMIFLWLTAMLARATYFFTDIPMGSVVHSGQFQLALLILWGIYGISHILAGHRLPMRRAWIAGAILMLIDIGKLLLVDLAHTGTITRIISFFVAGLLLLFIGWVAPLPPASAKQEKVPYES